jgi:S-(hydroxymethyl)glutathione dehydrogenase/alcohol dehydrogenase
MKTLAAILNETSAKLIVDEIEMPQELQSGQVIVQIITSGICGAQINEIDAIKGPDKFLPHLLGHEGYCQVVEVAKDVKTVKSGDYAILHWRPGSGIQSSPPKYYWRGNILNAGWVTTFNQHAVVSENRVTKIRKTSVSDSMLPLLGCALTTALGVLKNEAKVSADDSVLVFGAGGVGLSILKILKMLGIKRVVLIDIDEGKLKYAKSVGAIATILFQSKEQCYKELLDWYGDSPPSVAIETTGKVACIELAYEISHPQARVVLVGVPRKGEKSSIYTLPLHFGKSFVGSQGGRSNPQDDIPHLLNLLESKTLDFSDFPTREYTLQSINDALSDLKTGALGRMIIRMENM